MVVVFLFDFVVSEAAVEFLCGRQEWFFKPVVAVYVLINWMLSNNLSCAMLKEIYFSALFAMQVMLPFALWIFFFCIMRWLSYPLKLWNTTGIFVLPGLILSLRLQDLCAAPLYSPMK